MMVNTIFDLCVSFLAWLAQTLGISYQAVNVYIFVVMWPIVTLTLIAIVIVQQTALRKKSFQSPTT